MFNVDGDLYCPIIFDGWRCWPSTKAGETAYVECPRNQPGFSAERKYISSIQEALTSITSNFNFINETHA